MEFSLDEYSRRWEQVRVHMKFEGIDALLVNEAENIRYLCGYLPTAARHQYLLVPIEGPIIACIRKLDEPAFSGHTPLTEWVTFSDEEGPESLIAALLARYNFPITSLGLESDSHHLTLDRWRRILEFAPHSLSIQETSRLVRNVRLRKSAEEVTLLRKAGNVADAIVSDVARASLPGTTTRQLATRGYVCGFSLGADNGRMLLVSAGTRKVVFHGNLTDRPILSGEIVHIESVPQVDGYSARLMRPISVGTPDRQKLELADQLIAVQDEQINAMVAGAVAGEVDAICRRALLESNVRDDYPNATAYTLGLHATPLTSDFTRALMAEESWTLEAGMVFHVYTSASDLAFSETILVHADRSERLTTLRRGLLEAE